MKPRSQGDMTEGVIWRQLLTFFLPILMGSLFQQLYTVVDTMVVGRFVGKGALAAVDSTSSFTSLLINFFIGVASGTSVIVSQHFGARDEDAVSRAVHTGMALSLAGGALVTVLGTALAPFSFRAISLPEEIMDDTLLYIRVYFMGAMAQFAYNVGAGILRAVGDSRRPLYFLIIGCIVNILLDILFVAVFRMAILGAALATVFSQLISMVLVCAALMRTKDSYRLRLSAIRLHRDMTMPIIRVGVPMGLQTCMFSISNLIIRSSVNTFGTDTIAAWAVTERMDFIVWIVMAAFGVAITTFAGQNYGAEKYMRIRRGIRVSLLMGALSVIVISVVLYAFAPFFGSLFTEDDNVLSQSVYMVRFYAPFFITYLLCEIMSGGIRGTGQSFKPMMLTLFGTCILRVVWIFTAARMRHTITMVMLSYPITWSATSLLFVLYYFGGKWLRGRTIFHAAELDAEKEKA